MDYNLLDAYIELKEAFTQLSTEDKRDEIANRIINISNVINKIQPIGNIDNDSPIYSNEDEYLTYLLGLICNLENKLGNLFDSTTK